MIFWEELVSYLMALLQFSLLQSLLSYGSLEFFDDTSLLSNTVEVL